MNSYVYVLSVNGLIFILSLIFYYFPPKKINNFYGYRTHKSMLNQDIWDFANSQFSKSLVSYSSLSFAAALILTYLNPEQMKSWIPMGLMALTLLVCILKTEQGISSNFNEDGTRKEP